MSFEDKLIVILNALGWISIKLHRNIFSGIQAVPGTDNAVYVYYITEWLNCSQTHSILVTSMTDERWVVQMLGGTYMVDVPYERMLPQKRYVIGGYDINKKYSKGDVVQDLSGDMLIFDGENWEKMDV